MPATRTSLQPFAWLTTALLVLATACNWTPPSPLPTLEPPVEIAIPSPTVPVLPTADEVTASPHVPPAGWSTYTNRTFGYAFDYPAEAELVEVGVTGYPTEELPAGVDPGQYIATLEATYSEAICAGVRYGTAFLYISPPEEAGGRFSLPCGVSGVGTYDLRPVEESVTIGAETLNAQGSAIYSLGDGSFLYEFFFVPTRGFRFNYGGDWTQAGTTYEAYLADKAVLQQVLASWQWLE
jgi:hypothetical protein